MKKPRKNSNYHNTPPKQTQSFDFGQWLRKYGPEVGLDILRFLLLWAAFFVIELYAYGFLSPPRTAPLWFGLCWSLLLASVLYALPRKASRIVFGIIYYLMAGWTVAQVGYYQIFGKLMWFTSTLFAGEGAEFVGSILSNFSTSFWIFSLALLLLGVPLLIFYPKTARNHWVRLGMLAPAFFGILWLNLLPETVFVADKDVWGTKSEFGQSSSLRATYNTMYDPGNVYDICGIYQLSFRDLWVNHLYPLTPGYRSQVNAQRKQIDTYFENRGAHQSNDMTGIFAGKNVVVVLMESMDDWMITPTDTPTICRLMDEGINFTDFYTPGFGTARTINSEFCMNTGIYLPTTGKYVFDYITNDFRQSLAGVFTAQDYSAEVFHYNTRQFYSRGVMEPALGYDGYNTYMDYTSEKNDLYSDQYLFDNPQLHQLFFREGRTFNTIITRAAHGSYIYREVLSHYALKQYPEYRGKYGSEEEDCCRVKARLTDDTFQRLLQELEANGQLENTVIIAMTDHYTYLYDNKAELNQLSGTQDRSSLLLEKTPCFIWSADCPDLTVDKTLNTADLVPTVLNLMGIDPGWDYLGRDAFDPNYSGYAIFPNGSWISGGIVCQNGKVVECPEGVSYTEEFLEQMHRTARDFIHISNILLTSNYYKP